MPRLMAGQHGPRPVRRHLIGVAGGRLVLDLRRWTCVLPERRRDRKADERDGTGEVELCDPHENPLGKAEPFPATNCGEKLKAANALMRLA